MACFHPLQAWRSPGGAVTLAREQPDSTTLRLPCGGCLGCRQSKAREWALRCHLELTQHRDAVFTTLTYDDAHLPPTLSKRDLQLWLKRLRKATRRTPTRNVRFFAAGEYGETRGRPHYHAIVYGLSERHAPLIEETWSKGYCKTVTVTPAAIAYVAGYTSKKIGYRLHTEERVDPDTGEVYQWQPPFIQMSRRPGIGGHAKQWPESWRSYAVHNGNRMPVPRYLHEAWREQASKEEIEILEMEKAAQTALRDTTKARLRAAEQIAIARQQNQASKRKYE